MLRYGILGFLSYASMFGYELKRFMDGSIQHFWPAKLSQIYMTLKDLEAEGLVVSAVEQGDEGPDRRRYTLTPAGRSALKQWLAEPPAAPSAHRDGFLLKLFFSASADPRAVAASLRVALHQHERSLAILKTEAPKLIREGLEKTGVPPIEAVFWEATRRLGEMGEATYVAWLKETLATLEKLISQDTKKK